MFYLKITKLIFSSIKTLAEVTGWMDRELTMRGGEKTVSQVFATGTKGPEFDSPKSM